MPSHQWNAADYRQHSSAQQAWGSELIDKLGLQGHERVLDLGCGDGRLTALIAGRLPQGSVLGVDVSPEMIGFAQREHPPEAHPNLAFAVADASRLELAPQFDAVFSNAVLHWVADQRPVLAGVRRALKPGGRILFQMGGRGNGLDIFGAKDNLLARRRWAGHFQGFSDPYRFPGDDEYAVWLREAGLRPLRVELIPKDMTHQGREGLAGWVRTTWLPYLERLPEDLRGDFVEDLLDLHLSRRPLDAGGHSHVAMVRLEVEAVAP